MEYYKLYNARGYRCRVNIKELVFFFGFDPNITIDEVKKLLQENDTGYYIK